MRAFVGYVDLFLSARYVNKPTRIPTIFDGILNADSRSIASVDAIHRRLSRGDGATPKHPYPGCLRTCQLRPERHHWYGLKIGNHTMALKYAQGTRMFVHSPHDYPHFMPRPSSIS